MSLDSEVDARMSPKEVAETQKFEACQFRTTWAKAGLISRECSDQICDHCITLQALAMGDGGIGCRVPFNLNCRYPGGEYSAELSCAKCTHRGKLCGSQAIQAAHEEYVEKEKERRKKKRNARQTERREIRKKQEAMRALKREMRKNKKAEMLRAAARKQLRHDRRVAGLHRELTLLHRAHVEWASHTKSEEQREQECRQKRQQEEQEPLEHEECASLTESEERREQECHQKRQQEEQQQLELLATMNELIGIFKEGFA